MFVFFVCFFVYLFIYFFAIYTLRMVCLLSILVLFTTSHSTDREKLFNNPELREFKSTLKVVLWHYYKLNLSPPALPSPTPTPNPRFDVNFSCLWFKLAVILSISKSLLKLLAEARLPQLTTHGTDRENLFNNPKLREFFSSFPLFSWLWCLLWRWYGMAKFDDGHF